MEGDFNTFSPFCDKNEVIPNQPVPVEQNELYEHNLEPIDVSEVYLDKANQPEVESSSPSDVGSESNALPPVNFPHNYSIVKNRFT